MGVELIGRRKRQCHQNREVNSRALVRNGYAASSGDARLWHGSSTRWVNLRTAPVVTPDCGKMISRECFGTRVSVHFPPGLFTGRQCTY